MFYVGATRGRERNETFFYHRISREGDHQHRGPGEVHEPRRGGSCEAVSRMRDIIANDARTQAAHGVSRYTEHEHLGQLVRSFLDRRAKAVERRRKKYLEVQDRTHITLLDGESRTHRTRTLYSDKELRCDRVSVEIIFPAVDVSGEASSLESTSCGPSCIIHPQARPRKLMSRLPLLGCWRTRRSRYMPRGEVVQSSTLALRCASLLTPTPTFAFFRCKG